ncbi:hypothetical protein [Phaffia rhodozyma]|uniref:Uncharacterized protein n=1 Tax=Phaffia rhodozyma TaxID=264483 RepID=A0A0F7SL64_PHARH|nr:hypothetical protein [Phaffia rhodozyma]
MAAARLRICDPAILPCIENARIGLRASPLLRKLRAASSFVLPSLLPPGLLSHDMFKARFSPSQSQPSPQGEAKTNERPVIRLLLCIAFGVKTLPLGAPGFHP